MPRLIDADKLKDHYSWWKGGSREISLDEAKRNFDTIVDLQPTVDAEPVVRCKDCKWHYILNGHNRCDLLDLEARDIKPDWFCADGERREDADK